MKTELDFIPVHVSHTGEVIDAVVWGRINSTVGKDSILSAVVTDNGKNFKNAAS
jgi:hypothetical protein